MKKTLMGAATAALMAGMPTGEAIAGQVEASACNATGQCVPIPPILAIAAIIAGDPEAVGDLAENTLKEVGRVAERTGKEVERAANDVGDAIADVMGW